MLNNFFIKIKLEFYSNKCYTVSMNKNSIEEKPELLESYNELITLISKIEDRKLLEEIFGCLFTPTERRGFAERWQLVKELKAGTTQREIARKYNMSLCKITRGSKELQKPDSAFLKMLKMLED